MAKKDIRAQLVQAALKLAHRQGMEATSLVEIAKSAHVPPGNLYYYFKTKDEIARAMIAERLCNFEQAREALAALPSPKARLIAFVDKMVENRDMVVRGGCPLGSLAADLRKKGGASGKQAAALLGEPLAWMEEQFREIGRAEQARMLALHLLSNLQGASTVAYCLQDPDVISLEAERLKTWIDGL